jgi:hypothetical protein
MRILDFRSSPELTSASNSPKANVVADRTTCDTGVLSQVEQQFVLNLPAALMEWHPVR